MYRSRGVGGFMAGLVMVLIGVGATVVSYMLASPGGIFFVFGGLIIGGCYRMIASLFYAPVLVPRSRKRAQRGGGDGLPSMDYVDAPNRVPQGYCWQCGRQVKRGRGTCLACGAAQVTAAPKPQSAPTPAGAPWDASHLPGGVPPGYQSAQNGPAWGQPQPTWGPPAGSPHTGAVPVESQGVWTDGANGPAWPDRR